MAFTLKDRVKQYTMTDGTGGGTGTIVLQSAAIDGFQTFTTALADGDTFYYAIVDGDNNTWETGQGTWAESSRTITRNTIYDNSSGNTSAINFATNNAKDVFITQPASRAITLDNSGNIPLGTVTLDSSANITLDADGGTITFADGGASLGTITSSGYSGNAATATELATARNIGGVSFDGTGNIDLPGVNSAGNQDTTGTATNASHVLVTDNESTDEENLITFIENETSTTGNVGLEMDGNLTYNPSTGTVTATVFKGNIDAEDGDFDGTLEADEITVGGVALNTVIAGVTVTNATNATNSSHVLVTDNESTNENNLITFVENETSTTGNVGLEMDGNLTYNPSTGTVTATGFSGSLTGNASTATALATARNIGGVSFDGTTNIDLPGVNTAGNQNTSGTAAVATVATTVTITDNESTDQDNAIIFTAGGDVDGGNLGLESDGDLTYNPSTGRLTATQLAGTLQTAAQTNITSVGTLSSLQVDQINADASTITVTDSSDTGDKLEIVVGTHGATTITTTDDDASAANITITADGTFEAVGTGITLDSSGNINLEAEAGVVTTTTPSFSITDDTTGSPLLELKNTTNDTTSAELRFVKDKGAAGADDDSIGQISFYGDDTTQAQTKFGSIQAKIKEADNGDETGQLQFYVAGSSTTNYSGLKIEGNASNAGQVNVTLGRETGSTTTIIGNLEVNADADATTTLGRAKIASPASDIAYFSHVDFNTTTSYALAQTSSGLTALNAASGQTISLNINDVNQAEVTSSGLKIYNGAAPPHINRSLSSYYHFCGYPMGYYYTNANWSAGNLSGVLHYFPGETNSGVTVDGIGYRTNTADADAHVVYIGIYERNRYGMPGTRLHLATFTNGNASSGNKEDTTEFTLAPNWYWVLSTHTNETLSFATNYDAASGPSYFTNVMTGGPQYSSTPVNSVRYQGVLRMNSQSTLPTEFGTTSSGWYFWSTGRLISIRFKTDYAGE